MLSPNEKKVLTELSKGLKNKEVAEVLNMSMQSVSENLRRIYVKLKIDKSRNIHFVIVDAQKKSLI